MGNWDPVPWMVGGGAQHSANVGRNVAYAAFGGNEGVVNAADCEVRERTVPDGSVRVLPGTLAIKSRATGARDEMYVGRLPSTDTVAIAPTDFTGPRSDLIVARVEDPNEPGVVYPVPATPASGPYIYTRVISGVPAGTTTAAQAGGARTEIALARIDIPPSTGTITQAMIADLRVLSQPRKDRNLVVVAPTAESLLPKDSAYHAWPAAALTTLAVPSWATHLRASVLVGGVRFGAAGTNGGAGWDSNGFTRLKFAWSAGDPTVSDATSFNIHTDSGNDRFLMMAGSPSHKVPKGARGGTVAVYIDGTRTTGTAGAAQAIDSMSTISLDVEFYSNVESSV